MGRSIDRAAKLGIAVGQASSLPKTRRVDGHAITLIEGRRYRASRPMATRRDQRFTVSITNLDTNEVEVTVPGLGYEASNRLLAAFNNAASSFEGRVW